MPSYLSNDRSLHSFSKILCACTLFLICIGGIVTSKGVGMAVPDWPNSYGYNMFLFPISKWVGGIFYEHTHRLAGSLVGFLTLVLAIWLWLVKPKTLLTKLGWVALFLVSVQGVLGGLRVTLVKDELGIFHGTLAQLFFCLVCSLTLMTSSWWESAKNLHFGVLEQRLNRFVTVGVCLILLQLVLGATMRHQHAGLAIPDFPLAYGRVYPATDEASIQHYNAVRMETMAVKPITKAHIHIHMMHRLTALMILGVVGASYYRSRGSHISGDVRFWFALILVQLVLGAMTVLTSKSADVATAHVAVGALSLVVGWLTLLKLARVRRVGRHSHHAPSEVLLASAHGRTS